jgi:hypothetical protein
MLGTLGAADSVLQGGNADDAIVSGLTMGTLGAFGGRTSKKTYSEERLQKLQSLLDEFHWKEPAYIAGKALTKRFAPDYYGHNRIRLNHWIGDVNERLGRQTDVVSGYSIGYAPRFYTDRRKRSQGWRRGDWVRLNDVLEPTEILDAKYGRLTPSQLRKDKLVPLPTTYLGRDEIIRRAQELLKQDLPIDMRALVEKVLANALASSQQQPD